eukprot:jgi/Botrbrau1/10398/Bobra.0133s0007.1
MAPSKVLVDDALRLMSEPLAVQQSKSRAVRSRALADGNVRLKSESLAAQSTKVRAGRSRLSSDDALELQSDPLAVRKTKTKAVLAEPPVGEAFRPVQKRKAEAVQKRKATAVRLKPPAEDPFPLWPAPLPEQCRAVRDALAEQHGEPKNAQLGEPKVDSAGFEPCAPQITVLDSLVRTILSQNTTDITSGGPSPL